ncbi:PAS domain S-box protein [Leptolyngbya sp. FACHB-16]|nr:PAS domain S-box protein [Leptolyngbya sp. FACHB-16]MBD2158321.1 PAS domain S-box protein [Leptolyngbya sp. FACHB-16]
MSPPSRILLINQDEGQRRALQQRLEPYFDVVIADDEARAVAIAQTYPPRIILADRDIKIQLLLRETPQLKSIPLILLLSQSHHSDWSDTPLPEADDYLTVPCSQQELLTRLHLHLQRGPQLQTGEWPASPGKGDRPSCSESDQQWVEEALRRSESRYRMLANVVPQLLWVNDAVGNIVFYNQQWLEYTGQALQLGEGLWRSVIHPDDFESIYQIRSQAIQAGRAYEVECRLKRFDGTYRWHLARIVPVKNEQGQTVQWLGTATDIHTLKETQAALRESEAIARARAQELEAFMEAVPAGVWIAHDPECHHVTANPAAHQLLDCPPGSTVTATPANGIYPFPFHFEKDGQPLALTDLPMQRAGRLGEETQDEFDVVFADGRVRTLWGRSVPLWNEQGQVRGVIGTFTDMSEHKRTERILREREQRFSTLFNGMEDWGLVYHLSPDGRPGRLIEVNDQACKKLGYSREELLSMAVSDIIVSAFVDLAYSLKTLLENRRMMFESVHRHRDGHMIPCEVSATVFTLDGQLTVQSICRDITERRQAEQALRASEERYRQIVETADEGIWMVDANARTTFVNQKMAHLLGYTPNEMLGRKMYEFMDDEAIAIATANFQEQEQGIKEQQDFRFRCKGGSYIWTMISTNLLMNDRREFIGALAMITDVTARKQAEREREQILERERLARAEAERANRIKDEFLAILSHELRSPLNPILGWASLLQTRKVSEETLSQALQAIERNVRLQVQLVDDLLDVSRILRGKLALTEIPIDMVSIVNAAIETVQLAANAKSISIEMKPIDTKMMVLGDASRLQQVIWNLLSNAIKFSPNGGHVTIQLAQTDTQVQVQIHDTGKGISPDFLPHIFEHFRQQDSTTTRQFGGLGLGLAIVRYITEMHGGSVTADSPGEEQGATFTVLLPRLQQTEAEPDEPPQPLSASTGLQGLRILVVEDNNDTRDFLAFLLEQSGAVATAAPSAQEGLALLDQQSFDLLISDIGMPDMDGYMLIRQIRSRSPETGGKIPAIALTAFAGEQDRQQTQEAGFQVHVAKPIMPNQLIDTILAVLRQQA